MSSFNLKSIADKVNRLDSKQDFNLQNIDIEKIVPSEKNFYGMRDIEELSQDIKVNGLYHNLVVIPVDDKFKIISGERRYRALKSLGYKKVPCQVRNNVSDIDGEIMLIQANAKTRELTNTEKIKQIEKLEELYKEKRKNGEKLEGKTRDLIGKDLGLSGSQVGKYKKINKDLIPELKKMLEKNNLDMEKASSIAALDEAGQKEIYNILIENKNLNRDELNKLKKSLKEKKEGVRSEHVDMESIKFNAEIDLVIKNLNDNASTLIDRLKIHNELSKDNLKALNELKGKLKVIAELKDTDRKDPIMESNGWKYQQTKI